MIKLFHSRYFLSPALIAVISMLFISACDSEQAKTKTKTKAKRSHKVEVIQVKRAPVFTRRIVTGSLEAPNTVEVYNQEQGRITAIHYHPGDTVKKGAVLLELDSTLISAELDKAKASYQQALLDLQRIKRLVPRKLASEDELARASTAVEQSRAEQTLLETRVQRTRIKAPFDGIVSARLREPGDVVPLHSHIMTLYDPGELIAKIHLSEILLSNIHVGLKVSLRVDALGDLEFAASVTRKYPTIDPTTRQGTLEVTLDKRIEAARPGQLVRILIDGKTQPLQTIPLVALRHDTRGDFVYKVVSQKNKKTGKTEQRSQYTPVTTGIQLEDRIEILTGLNENDIIISKGFHRLRDKKLVSITNRRNNKVSNNDASNKDKL